MGQRGSIDYISSTTKGAREGGVVLASTLQRERGGSILQLRNNKYGIVLKTILSNIINIDYQVRNELRNFTAKSDTIQVDEEQKIEKTEKKEEKKSIGFFTDSADVKLDKYMSKATCGNDIYRLKFTDGTDEYYVLTECGDFDYQRGGIIKEEAEELAVVDTNTFCYLVPSDVISRTFPDGDIPEHLSYEDANKIENSKGNIELRYNHIFGWRKTIRAIKAQKERQKRKRDKKNEEE